MKKPSYRRKPGEFEIRILRDGTVVFGAPNEALMDLAQELDLKNTTMHKRKEAYAHVRPPRQ